MRHPAAKTTIQRVFIVIILILPRFLLPLAVPSLPRDDMSAGNDIPKRERGGPANSTVVPPPAAVGQESRQVIERK
jgi:hypothetical protein